MMNNLAVSGTTTYTFTEDPAYPSFKSRPATTTPANTYQPYGNLNSFNLGQTADGTWQLYAQQKNPFVGTASITSWNITFGTTNLVVGGSNQSCSTALPLPNTTQTGTFASGTNEYNGIVVTDSKGSEVGNSGLTETSIWYSFTPKCKDDQIQITSANAYIQAGILSGTCGARKIVSTNGNFINSSYTFPVTTYVPGATYFVVMDGSEADIFQYQVKWKTGTTGCLSNSITTSNVPKTSYCSNDSIYVPFSFSGVFTTGNRFTAQLSDANGSFASPYTIGYVDATSASLIKSQLPANLPSGTGYQVRVIASTPATIGTSSTAFQIANAPAAPITLNGNRTVCVGQTNVPYSVTTVAGATHYTWQLGGNAKIVSAVSDSSNVTINVGSTSSQINIRAVNACGTSASLQQTIAVNQNVTPSISIAVSKDTICQGDSVQFMATPINQGASPVYQWKINQTAVVGVNAASFATKSIKKGDTVSVTLTSNQTCLTTPTAVSNRINLVVRDTISPTVNILGNTTYCQGGTAHFIASTKNKGSSPLFNWYINKVKQSVNDSLLSLSTLQNNDTIRVQLQSSVLCTTPSWVSAVPVVVQVATSIAPVVTISGDSSGCEGSLLTFNARISGGGNTPVFIWKVNGQIKGTNSPQFSGNQFADGDKVTVELQSSESCANPTTVNSTVKTVSIQANQTPSVTIDITRIGICEGDSFTFQAHSTLGGPKPLYTWTINKVISGNDSVFFSRRLQNGDSVKLDVVSNETCLNTNHASDFKVVAVTDTIRPSIDISGSTSFCKGSPITYRATSKNAGADALFKWYVNNNLQTVTDSLLTINTLQNNDSLWATLQSTTRCVRPSLVYSPKVYVHVIDTVKPSIILSGTNSSCQGTLVNFSTTIHNGGNAPSYAWFVNGNIQSNILPTFSGKSFQNGDTVQVQLTSNALCSVPSQVKSNVLGLTIHDTLTPSIQLLSDSVICKGQITNVNTTLQNAGNQPVIVWQIDGITTNQQSTSLPLAGLTVGKHSIKASLTSSETCARPASITAAISVRVKDSVNAIVRITGDTVVCAGSNATFQLRLPISLSNTTYQWLTNGSSIGNSTNTLSTVSLTNNDKISLLVQTDETCIASPIILSNVLTIKSITSTSPIVSVNASPATICPGETVTYIASITHPGTSESFTWYANNTVLLPSTSDSLLFAPSVETQIKLTYRTLLACGVYSIDQLASPIIVKDPPPVLQSIMGPTDYCAQDKDLVFATDLVPNATYSWSFPAYIKGTGAGNKITLNLGGNAQTDTLKVQASNSCGLGNVATYVLRPKNCPTLFIPNAIVISDENGNGMWQIKGIDQYPNASVMVYNRWGSRVFHSKGYYNAWDGSYQEKPLPTGTYYYVIEGIHDKPIVGDLTIIH